MSDALVYT